MVNHIRLVKNVQAKQWMNYQQDGYQLPAILKMDFMMRIILNAMA